MKCEPHGPIQLDKTNDERLGIQGTLDAQLQLISSLDSQANLPCGSCIGLPSHSNSAKKQISKIH